MEKVSAFYISKLKVSSVLRQLSYSIRSIRKMLQKEKENKDEEEEEEKFYAKL